MVAARTRAPRLALLGGASIAVCLLAVGSCSLAGLADPPQASSSTGSGASGSGGSGPASLFYEAEDAGLYGSFVIGDDPDASNGKYVYVPVGVSCSDGLSEVVFDVALDAAGTYVVWARVSTNSSDHDSFFVSVDMGQEAVFRVPTLGPFVEEGVSDSASEVKAAIHYPWDAGDHRIVFKCRTAGAFLDRIRIEAAPP
jgi:hypothetical protein